jgi:hypothetical protein
MRGEIKQNLWGNEKYVTNIDVEITRVEISVGRKTILIRIFEKERVESLICLVYVILC